MTCNLIDVSQSYQQVSSSGEYRERLCDCGLRVAISHGSMIMCIHVPGYNSFYSGSFPWIVTNVVWKPGMTCEEIRSIAVMVESLE